MLFRSPTAQLTSISVVSMALLALGCSAAAPDGDGAGSGAGNGSGTGSGTGSGNGSGSGTGSGSGEELVIDDTDLEGEVIEVPDCDNNLEVIVRDFDESHPDMGESIFIGDVVRRELVAYDLGGDKKPVFASSQGCPAGNNPTTPTGGCMDWGPTIEPAITDATSFSSWYKDTDGVNISFDKTLVLEDPDGDGTYVYDNADFFPLGPDEGFGPTPPDHHTGKNYLFTTEIHLQFDYVSGQQFTFRGDDDLWVFINGKLALDLGSKHLPVEGTIDFDAQAAELGITPGLPYSMDIFHAERQWTGSNFRIETNISCFVPVTEGIVR